MTKDNVQDTAAAALLLEKINEVRELKIRCSLQENQLTTMSGLLQSTREDNRKLRIKSERNEQKVRGSCAEVEFSPL